MKQLTHPIFTEKERNEKKTNEKKRKKYLTNKPNSFSLRFPTLTTV
jgi:hypothetical protein